MAGSAGLGGVADLFAVGAVGLIAGGSEVVEVREGSERWTADFPGAVAVAVVLGLFISPLMWST